MSDRRNRRNYYRILHVQPDAPAAVLKSSYRTLMRSLEMHPDRGGEHWDAALINEAYEVLSDPTKRAEYDRSLDLDRVRSSRAADAGIAVGPVARDPDLAEAIGERCCLFCGAVRTFTGSLPADATCRRCLSPMAPAGAPRLEASGRRAAARIARDGEIRYYVDWPHPAPARGRIVDLSPRGLCFESDAPLGVHQIVKLEGPLLDAVARVASCRARGVSFAVGVQFYTVRFHQPRGTFLSTTA